MSGKIEQTDAGVRNPASDSKSVDELSSQMSRTKIDGSPISNDNSIALPFINRPLPLFEQQTRTFQVQANYFRLHFKENMMLYHYNVEFLNSRNMPMIKPDFTSKAFWWAYRTGRDLFPDHHSIAFNGVNMLWSIEKIKRAEATIQFTTEEPSDARRQPKKYIMKIRYTGMVELKAQPTEVAEQTVLSTVLDAVLTSRLTCLYESGSKFFEKTGRNIFCTSQVGGNYVHDLGEMLEAWTGLHAAVKTSLQGGLMVNVDLCHSAFYKKGYSIVSLLEAWANINSASNEHLSGDAAMNQMQRKKLEDMLRGLTLEYRGTRIKKTFKFTELGRNAACTQYFLWSKENRQVSIEEYFYLEYGFRLKYPNLPCVLINRTNRNYAPLEMVFTDSIVKKFKGRISERELKKLVKAASFPPNMRKQLIEEMASGNHQDPRRPVYLAEQDDYMKRFGVEVDRNFLEVTASLLPPPTLQFGDCELRDDTHGGVWDLKQGTTLKKIRNDDFALIPSLIFFTPNYKGNEDRYPCNPGPLGSLLNVLYNMGVNCPGGSRSYATANFDWNKETWKDLCRMMEELKGNITADKSLPENSIPLVVFVFPFRCSANTYLERSTEYAKVKYICDVVVGIHCQAILEKNYDTMINGSINNTTAHLVALKILGKLGRSLYILENPDDESWSLLTNPKESTLVLGIDVTHAGTEERRLGKYSAVSVAAVVGNIDLHCLNFEATGRTQSLGQERTFHLQPQIKHRIEEFVKHTGSWPAHIVVFRDAVSESEFQKVLNEEVTAVKRAIEEVKSTEKRPTVSYLMNQKRHHTRFFAINNLDTAGKGGNLKPGTLMETTVTSSSLYDFYLIPHRGVLGTSRPAHIFVLYDEWAPNSCFWQKICYQYCYGFIRCTNSISQPAPLAYAHLAAKRAKDYIKAHLDLNEEQLQNISEYEIFHSLSNIQKKENHSGMVFV